MVEESFVIYTSRMHQIDGFLAISIAYTKPIYAINYFFGRETKNSETFPGYSWSFYFSLTFPGFPGFPVFQSPDNHGGSWETAAIEGGWEIEKENGGSQTRRPPSYDAKNLVSVKMKLAKLLGWSNVQCVATWLKPTVRRKSVRSMGLSPWWWYVRLTKQKKEKGKVRSLRWSRFMGFTLWDKISADKNCRISDLLPKILSAEKFCPPKILSAEIFRPLKSKTC